MSMTFTKLFSSITESTIWTEKDHVRIAWICMLAMADRKGRVWASVPGFANRCRISLQDAEDALSKFLGPDPYSRTPDNEGRRIEKIDGGWRLLNFEKYRSIRDEEASKESKRNYITNRRAREKGANVENVEQSRTQSNAVGSCRDNAEAEAEAEAESSKVSLSSTTPIALGGKAAARERMTKPTIAELRLHCAKIGLPDDEAVKFHAWFESVGWVVGRAKTPMKSWVSAMTTWKSKWEESRNRNHTTRGGEHREIQETIIPKFFET